MVRTVPDWGPRFLAALEQVGVITRACELAHIGRTAVYYRRDSDDEFAAAMAEAMTGFKDSILSEGIRRARDGIPKPVIYKGELRTYWAMPDGTPTHPGTPGARELPLTTREYSDPLLLAFLKAYHPELFRESIKHEGTINTTVHYDPAAFADLPHNEQVQQYEEALRAPAGPARPA